MLSPLRQRFSTLSKGHTWHFAVNWVLLYSKYRNIFYYNLPQHFVFFLVLTNDESIIQSSTNKLTPKITQLQLETPHSIVLDFLNAEAPTCSRFPCKLEHFPRERGPGDELLGWCAKLTRKSPFAPPTKWRTGSCSIMIYSGSVASWLSDRFSGQDRGPSSFI